MAFIPPWAAFGAWCHFSKLPGHFQPLNAIGAFVAAVERAEQSPRRTDRKEAGFILFSFKKWIIMCSLVATWRPPLRKYSHCSGAIAFSFRGLERQGDKPKGLVGPAFGRTADGSNRRFEARHLENSPVDCSQ